MKNSTRLNVSLLAHPLSLVLLLLPTLSHAEAFIFDKHGHKINLKAHPAPPRADECEFCHTPKKREFISKKSKTHLEHEGKSGLHGRVEMACQHCHDINHYNYLLSSTSAVSTWENSSGVCARCHADRYRDWKAGMHGKRVGTWKTAEATQYSCIDCHDPHAIGRKTTEALPVVKEPKLLIRKNESDTENGLDERMK